MDDDHLDHTIPNHHPTKMDVLPKLFAAKWHTRHLSTTPKQHSNNLCILFCINPSYRTIDKSNMLSNQSPPFAGPPTIQGSMVIMDYEHVISEIDLLFSLRLLKYFKNFVYFQYSRHDPPKLRPPCGRTIAEGFIQKRTQRSSLLLEGQISCRASYFVPERFEEQDKIILEQDDLNGRLCLQ